ncbi:peroxiredoxin [Alicyclobacillus tolerans]|uniref:Peroxiredoxin n=2 Tax=Alicyclobacillus tolerans TaxID=90970 RepID=A0ABT9LUR8_9BACL|nr:MULTISPECIES: peroxiredoxin [Alicyclobacillus]MDP9728018.1 peroxiredoxin (alkyl hydroperoxide reductase subunit C) [Alicyclobacillus tengchongensis]QRF24302.1 peroxiredoxin [Alicyclobacillus sp. TC]SHJ91853.1 peroxiredoxin (alkyl hydroperoxide reductase subunit C) [Alicyclobacillus montanus]
MSDTQVTLPKLNEPAPDFEAVTTQGKLKLSDFRGKYVVLFSHPADFTPVCSTEFGSFASRQEEFTARNVQLIGLSVDGVQAHLAWINDIERIFGQKINFPVIADLDMKVSSLYGMIHPGASSTAAVRAVFVIDDKGVLRAMIYYPMSVGRNISEILRVVDALQTNDKHGVSTPADWTPGAPVVVAPPATASAIESQQEAEAKGLEYKSWYLRTKKL